MHYKVMDKGRSKKKLFLTLLLLTVICSSEALSSVGGAGSDDEKTSRGQSSSDVRDFLINQHPDSYFFDLKEEESKKEGIKTKSVKPTLPEEKKSDSQAPAPIALDNTKEANNCEWFGKQGMKQVPNTTVWPYSAIGLVSFTGGGRGTGVLIGPDVVLTAAHNVRQCTAKTQLTAEKRTEQVPKQVHFFPGIDGHEYEVDRIFVRKDSWLTDNECPELEEDYALLFLKHSVGITAGYFGLAVLNDDCIKMKKINVTGYPSYPPLGVDKPDKRQVMWGMDIPCGKCVDIGQPASGLRTSGRIGYNIETHKGQSGAGVFYNGGEDCYIVAVHVIGGGSMPNNYGTRITMDRYKKIKEWIVQYRKGTMSEETLRKGIRELNLSGKNVNFLKNLLAFSFPDLTELDLSSNNLGDEGAEVVASSTNLPALTVLNLSLNQIGNSGTRAIATSQNFKSLRNLDLSHNLINDEGVSSIASSSQLTLLVNLDLKGNSIHDSGMFAIVKSECFNNLENLILSDNFIGNLGALAIPGFQHLKGIPKLKILDIADNLVENSDIRQAVGVFMSTRKGKAETAGKQQLICPAIVCGHERVYQRFLKGALVYRPTPGSDAGKIELPIGALANPLKGTFDLSRCGDTGNYLSIATGYRKGKNPQNKDKVEIWIAPRFMIEKELATTAGHFKEIMGKWNKERAPVGLFWTWGNWESGEASMDYLTDNSFARVGVRYYGVLL